MVVPPHYFAPTRSPSTQGFALLPMSEATIAQDLRRLHSALESAEERFDDISTILCTVAGCPVLPALERTIVAELGEEFEQLRRVHRFSSVTLANTDYLCFVKGIQRYGLAIAGSCDPSTSISVL